VRALSVVHESTGRRLVRKFYPMRFLWRIHAILLLIHITCIPCCWGRPGHCWGLVVGKIPNLATSGKCASEFRSYRIQKNGASRVAINVIENTRGETDGPNGGWKYSRGDHVQVLSRDSVTVSVEAVVYYRVSNPTLATNNIEDYRSASYLLQ
jgi:hypothetical protein